MIGTRGAAARTALDSAMARRQLRATHDAHSQGVHLAGGTPRAPRWR